MSQSPSKASEVKAGQPKAVLRRPTASAVQGAAATSAGQRGGCPHMRKIHQQITALSSYTLFMLKGHAKAGENSSTWQESSCWSRWHLPGLQLSRLDLFCQPGMMRCRKDVSQGAGGFYSSTCHEHVSCRRPEHRHLRRGGSSTWCHDAKLHCNMPMTESCLAPVRQLLSRRLSRCCLRGMRPPLRGRTS